MSIDPKHIIFSKGFAEKKFLEFRDALGGSEAGICWYWSPSPPGEKLPNPTKVDAAQLDFFTSMIAKHIKDVIDGVVRDGREGVDGIYQL